jgi:predicted metal-dependent peptidase
MQSFIPVREFDGTSPSIGYTDFTNVYISTSVVREDERTVLLLHENSHIWLDHFTRYKTKNAVSWVNRTLWNIACDMEIAIHMYTDADERVINGPRSMLAGGITKKDAEKYAPAMYAEELYDKLLDETEQKIQELVEKLLDSANEEFLTEDDGETPQELSEIEKEVLVRAAKQLRDEQANADDIQKSKKQAQKSVDGFTPPRPSAGSLIDRHLGRSAVTRVASYRRPSRRQSQSQFLRKGIASAPKSPRLTLYVDRSGSFSADKTAQSVDVVMQLLTKYRGRVEHDVIYFNDALMKTDPGNGSGGTNYQPVVDNICADRAQLSIIITDSDSAAGLSVPHDLPPIFVIPVGCKKTSLASTLKVFDASL